MSAQAVMGKMYGGLPKPGHAVFEGAVALGRTPGVRVRSRYLARYLGAECVEVASAGVTTVAHRPEPRPVGVFTDMLQHQPGQPAGLVVEDADQEPWVACSRMVLGAMEERGMVVVLPADQHLNPALLRKDALTGYTLVPELLYPAEKARLSSLPHLATRVGSALTLGEYQELFGPVVDKEDRNFLPHCREGVVEYIPSVQAMLQRQHAKVRAALAAGEATPVAHVLPDFKTGLSCLSAPDGRGLHGNLLRDILLGAQRGLYLDGDARPHAKLALVGGTAHEYSVAELIRFLVDMDCSVVWLLSCTGGLGIGAKLATALDLMERYGSRLFCTWGWPLAEHLGPAPAGFAALAAQVEAQDRTAWKEHEAQRAGLVAGVCTSQGKPVVVAADAIAAARVTP